MAACRMLMFEPRTLLPPQAEHNTEREGVKYGRVERGSKRRAERWMEEGGEREGVGKRGERARDKRDERSS